MLRKQFLRWHVWLGWLVGVPILLWTGTGLFMVAQPIDRVHGEHLKRPPLPLAIPARLTVPDTGSKPLKSLAIEMRQGGPRWIMSYADGTAAMADPETGARLPPLNQAAAANQARAAFAGSAALQSMTFTPADAPPIDLRRKRPAWRATFADGTRIYIDADTGAILATRTQLWRVFDFMWGLHIMDLQTREDTSHPLLIGSAALALVTVLAGIVLLPIRRKRR